MKKYKMFVWRKDVLTAYTDGIAIAVSRDVEQAREILTQKFWDEEIKSNMDTECTLEDWPLSEYEKFRKALNQTPQIMEFPCAVYKNGGE